jgi:glutaconate CoA-transferase subunit A
MVYLYERDEEMIKEWVEAFKEEQTARAYLDRYVFGLRNHEEYLQLIGPERLAAVQWQEEEF